MYSKVLFLVLLGTSLALANPVNSENEGSDGNNWLNKIGDTIKHIQENIKEKLEANKANIDKTVAEIKKQIEQTIGKEKLDELHKQIEEIKEKAKKAIEDIRKECEKRIAEWKQKGGENLEKDKLAELKEQAEGAIKKEQVSLREKLDKLKLKLKDGADGVGYGEWE